jgi:hypothetical protein
MIGRLNIFFELLETPIYPTVVRLANKSRDGRAYMKEITNHALRGDILSTEAEKHFL